MPRHKDPSKLKVIRGTSRKDRELVNQMNLSELLIIPECPIELSRIDRGTSIWNDSTQDLFNLGMLHSADLQLLMSYCVEMSRYWICQDEIYEHGKSTYEMLDNEGNVRQKIPLPQIKMAKEHLSMAKSIAQQFGFTPSARAGISMPTQSKKLDPIDELQEKYK